MERGAEHSPGRMRQVDPAPHTLHKATFKLLCDKYKVASKTVSYGLIALWSKRICELAGKPKGHMESEILNRQYSTHTWKIVRLLHATIMILKLKVKLI